mmetsp:Transcript_41220/g.129511  ORF Transcript_41220/g.129511 Transcript_41220/m.129511 type:complete len:127 (-) Transcript_41220:725-1105(-)
MSSIITRTLILAKSCYMNSDGASSSNWTAEIQKRLLSSIVFDVRLVNGASFASTILWWAHLILLLNPIHDNMHNPVLLFAAQLTFMANMVPLEQALPATCGRGMLGKEYRVTPHGSLPSVHNSLES